MWLLSAPEFEMEVQRIKHTNNEAGECDHQIVNQGIRTRILGHVKHQNYHADTKHGSQKHKQRAQGPADPGSF